MSEKSLTVNEDNKAEIIYLTEDGSVYADMKGTCFYSVENGKTELLERWRETSNKWRFIKYLLENPGQYIEFEKIYNSFRYNDDEDYAYISVTNQYKEVIKSDFYKKAKEKGFVISTLSHSYKIELPHQKDASLLIGSSGQPVYSAAEEVLKFNLTENPVYVSMSEIIYREEFVDSIINSLITKDKNINIYGMGGLGKTSVAQLIYFKCSKNTDEKRFFDHVGFINYKQNLKTSICSAFNIYSGIENIDAKWKKISNLMKNIEGSALLIIDNVDKDISKKQNPLSEEDKEIFREISGWPNVYIVLTSRIKNHLGFRSVPLETLGNENNIAPCVDLFRLFNNREEDKRKDIEKLIKMCGYNTYAIELMARASRLEPSLDEFYNKISTGNIQNVDTSFETGHRYESDTIANHLKNLFDASKRDEKEKDILLYFATLPDMEKISENEMLSWFGVRGDETKNLIDEGWMNFKGGKYYVHPLVREAIRVPYDKNTIPEKFGSRVFELIKSNSFWKKNEEYNEVIRKISIAESMLSVISVSDIFDRAILHLLTADKARAVGMRGTAIKIYKISYETFDANKTYLSDAKKEMYWKACYYLGYVLSYTNSRLKEAEKYLRKAKKISEEIYKNNNSTKNYEHLSTSWDHLGYVLSSLGDSYSDEAEKCLRKALEMRGEILDSKNSESIQMYAWTADNLGYFLSHYEERFEESEALLKDALEKRIEIADGASSEVAWTLSNISNLYMRNREHFNKAEPYIKDAIREYLELEELAPETHYASLAYIYNNYGILLLMSEDRIDEAVEKLKQALGLYNRLEHKYCGSYFAEIAMVSSNLAYALEMNRCNAEEIVAEYEEGIEILEQYNADNEYDMDLADIKYNFWLFLVKNDLSISKRRKLRRFIFKCWAEANVEGERYEKFFNESNQIELDKEFHISMSNMLFVQAGARKHIIWADEL